MKLVLSFLLLTAALLSDDGVITSTFSKTQPGLSADPASSFWRDAPPVFALNDQMGRPVPGHRTEIRSRWTRENLYLLFVCPYQALYLNPNPTTEKETNHLWDWDVAEAFIGWDKNNIKRYKEFEVSPQGEWVDLDIDRVHPLPEGGWLWNSGFRSKVHVDSTAKIWYCVMQIPWKTIDEREPRAGNELRVNFYRMQGPPPERKMIAWQPTHARSYHVPEAFGILRLK